ncbi:MAG: AraC family transcriptional regulator [Bacteroidales bacterium]|nr:AraC family transcriptional regulator [Bacteroidales bacterium]MCF8334769.1 AraC family transcriptional regulator [Bacteroidales bacterium]
MPNEYTKRLNITLDYIEKHLDKTFTLEELAVVTSFSKYHFTRIFCSLTGETPFQYITRIRMEKAAFMMIANPELSVTYIALNYAYNDLTVCSRNFKKFFQMTPTQFRE